MAFSTNMTADQMMQAYRAQLQRDLFTAEGFRNAHQAQIDALKERISSFDKNWNPSK